MTQTCHTSNNKGFTLIELLIAIAIIGALASIILFTYPNAQRSARDAQRRSDIKQYQAALEIFANKESGLYPKNTTGAGISNTTLCNATYLDLATCPNDPRDGTSNCQGNTCGYRYQSTNCAGANATPCATGYVLWAPLEVSDASGNDVFFVTCSNGNSGEVTGSLSVSGGSCPL